MWDSSRYLPEHGDNDDQNNDDQLEHVWGLRNRSDDDVDGSGSVRDDVVEAVSPWNAFQGGYALFEIWHKQKTCNQSETKR